MLNDLKKAKLDFEQSCQIYDSSKLIFVGVDGFDVYNSSIPFFWNNKEYIFGRVERRDEWARSWVRLFENTGQDNWTLVPDSMIYPLEDPYVSFIGNEITLGGTHVQMIAGDIGTFYGYFYRGSNIHDMLFFTSGPAGMKDIRLIDLGTKIGVFSRPRGEHIREKHGSEAIVGYTEISSLNELDPEAIENALIVNNLFGKDQWGGANQVYLLEDGMLGVIGHISYIDGDLQVYMNMSFVLDRKTNNAGELKIIGTRMCYPDGPFKKPYLADCVFTGGLVMREDGKADLYSGVGDVETGRITIDYPFEGHGRIISK